MSIFPRVGKLNILTTCVLNCISYDVILSLNDKMFFMST